MKLYCVMVQYDEDEDAELDSIWSTDEVASRRRTVLLVQRQAHAAWISIKTLDDPAV